MANFTAKDVNELRKNTGVGMMDCKKALTEADGDVEKAMLILREKGLEYVRFYVQFVEQILPDPRTGKKKLITGKYMEGRD